MSKLSAITLKCKQFIQHQAAYWFQKTMKNYLNPQIQQFTQLTNVFRFAECQNDNELINEEFQTNVQQQISQYDDESVEIEDPFMQANESDISMVEQMIQQVFAESDNSVIPQTSKISKKLRIRFDNMDIPWTDNVLAVTLAELYVSQKVSASCLDSILSCLNELSKLEPRQIKQILNGCQKNIFETHMFIRMSYNNINEHQSQIYGTKIKSGESIKSNKTTLTSGVYEDEEFFAPICDAFEQAIADFNSKPRQQYRKMMNDKRQANDAKLKTIWVNAPSNTQYCRQMANQNLFLQAIGQQCYYKSAKHDNFVFRFFPGYIIAHKSVGIKYAQYYLIWFIDHGCISLPQKNENGIINAYYNINLNHKLNQLDVECLSDAKTEAKCTPMIHAIRINPINNTQSDPLYQEFSLIGITHEDQFRLELTIIDLFKCVTNGDEFNIGNTIIANIHRKIVTPPGVKFDDTPTFKINDVKYIATTPKPNCTYISVTNEKPGCFVEERDIISTDEEKDIDITTTSNIASMSNPTTITHESNESNESNESHQSDIIDEDHPIFQACRELIYRVRDIFWWVYHNNGRHPYAQMQMIDLQVFFDAVDTGHHLSIAPSIEVINARNLTGDPKHIWLVGASWKDRGIAELFGIIMRTMYNYLMIGSEGTYYNIETNQKEPCYYFGNIGLFAFDWPARTALTLTASHSAAKSNPTFMTNHLHYKESISNLFHTGGVKSDATILLLHQKLKQLQSTEQITQKQLTDVLRKFRLSGSFVKQDFPCVIGPCNNRSGADTFHTCSNVLKKNGQFHGDYITQGTYSAIRKQILSEIMKQMQKQCKISYMNKASLKAIYSGKAAHKIRRTWQSCFFLYFAIRCVMCDNIDFKCENYDEQQYRQIYDVYHDLLVIISLLHSSFWSWNTQKNTIKKFDNYTQVMKNSKCKITTKSKEDVEKIQTPMNVIQLPSFAPFIEILVINALHHGSPLTLSCERFESSLRWIKLAAQSTSWAHPKYKLMILSKSVKEREQFNETMIPLLYSKRNSLLLARMPFYMQEGL